MPKAGRRALRALSVWGAVALTGCSLLGGSGEAGAPSPQSPALLAASGAPTVPAPASRGAPAPAGSALPSALPSLRDVVAQVKPAVVQITTTQQTLDFFNRPVPQQTGVGSGVIYDPAGYILTNNHVVDGADKLTVALPDGRSFEGKLVGADPDTDLAVVQIQAGNLPVAQLGDSGQLKVGYWVVAIGNALALPGGPTVTQGVVSALGRTVQEPGNQQTGAAGAFLYDLIQTDAPINPGNSGGALANLNAEVVGINTLVAGIAEPGLQAVGIGFAISVNSAKPIAQQLVANGKAVHPYLGIQYTILTPSLARQLGIQDTKGVVAVQVVRNSPAARAGLQRLDVITQIDGRQIADESTIGRVLNSHKPGDTVTLAVQRGGQTMQIKVTLGEKPTGTQ